VSECTACCGECRECGRGMCAVVSDHPAKAFVSLTRLAESQDKAGRWQGEARRLRKGIAAAVAKHDDASPFVVPLGYEAALNDLRALIEVAP